MRDIRKSFTAGGALAAALTLFVGLSAGAQTAVPASATHALPPGPCAAVEPLIAAGNLAATDFESDAAEADFGQAIAQAPRCATGWLRRGELRLGNFDNAGAAADAKAAVAMAPRSAEAYGLLGEAEMRPWTQGGQFDDKDHKQAQAILADLSRAIDLGLADSRILAARATIYAALADYDHAFADSDRAIAQDPHNADLFITRGDIWRAKGDRDRALADFAQARAIAPDEEDGYSNAANLYDSHNDIDAAIAMLSQGLDRPNPIDDLYGRRADLYERKGDFAHAIADRTAAIDADHLPRATHYRQRAETYAAAGDIDHALADADMYILLDPKFDGAYIARGDIEFQAGRVAAGRTDFDHARTLRSERSTYTDNEMCWDQAAAGVDLDKALADCNAALAKSPRYANALDSRGFVYFRMGQYDAAIADYTAALKLRARMASSLFGRGLAEQKKGMTTEAAADLAAARAADPTIDETFKGYGVTAN